MILEILGLLLLLPMMTFPLWIHNNWKILYFDKNYKLLMKIQKEERKKYKNLLKEHKNDPIIAPKKICTQTQPFQIDEKHYIICNFSCDGNCRLIKQINYE